MGLAGALLISVVATATASADQWLVNGASIATGGSAEVTFKSGASALISKVGGTEIVILCAKDKGTGLLLPLGASNGTIEFTECKVDKPESCKVKEPIIFKFKDQLILPAEKEMVDEFKPEEGTTFVKITITGCALEGIYNVTGTQTTDLVTEESKTEQKLVFLT